jgi:hypothetical protein
MNYYGCLYDPHDEYYDEELYYDYRQTQVVHQLPDDAHLLEDNGDHNNNDGDDGNDGNDDGEEKEEEDELQAQNRQMEQELLEYQHFQSVMRRGLIKTLPVTVTNAPPFQYPWSPQVEQRGRRNVQRMREWKTNSSNQQILSPSHQLQCNMRMPQKIDAPPASPLHPWLKLPDNEKWRKEALLRCLQCSAGDLPKPLTEREWQSSVPTAFQDDIDLWDARLQRMEFAAAYRKTAKEPSKLHLTSLILGAKRIVMKLLQVFPEGLYNQTLSDDLLKDVDVFAAALKIPTRYQNTLHKEFLLRFSNTLRRNYMLFLDHATDTMSLEDIIAVANQELRSHAYFATELVRKVYIVPDNALSLFTSQLRDSPEVVMECVKWNGNNLEYASRRLRNN